MLCHPSLMGKWFIPTNCNFPSFTWNSVSKLALELPCQTEDFTSQNRGLLITMPQPRPTLSVPMLFRHSCPDHPDCGTLVSRSLLTAESEERDATMATW